MDADSSYGGSDTAQDSTLSHDTSSLETTTIPIHIESAPHDAADSVTVKTNNDSNAYYKNEITLPVNYDETDADKSSLPHYLSTAKLNIEESLENHSNLDELSKNYSSTHNLNAETPKKASGGGLDNPAYQDDETKAPPPATNGGLKSTFDEKKTYNNGDLNSSASLGFTSPAKTDAPMTEAVNLELINLKPTGKDVVGPYENGNGISDIPIKKEAEVEIGNPYDEYFVPVNEHRKYMSTLGKGRNSVTFAETISSAGVDNAGLSLTTPERGIVEYPKWLTALERGEKLYVTKDKRDKKSRNRCLCWGIFLAIVVAAVIVGILAAVGIIGNQEAQPVQEARNFGNSPGSEESEIKTSGGFLGISPERAGGHSSSTESPSPNYPMSPEPPRSTVSNILPTTDTSRIEVPRALQSEFKIENLQYSPELANKNSTEYKNLASALEKELLSTLFTNEILNYGAADIKLKIMEFLPGSVIVKYRIGWEFKDGIHDPKDPIDISVLTNRIQNALTNNGGHIQNYQVQGESVNANKIINMCQIQNNECEFGCSFDYNSVDFSCTCPTYQHLGSDGKRCFDGPAPSTENDVVDFEFEHVTELNTHPKPEPQPTTMNFEPTEPHVHPEPEPVAHPEPTAQPEPEPTAEPMVKPEPTYFIPTVQPEPEPQPDYTTTHHHESSNTPEPTVHTMVSSSETEAAPEPEPTSQPEPVVVSKSDYTLKSETNQNTTYKFDQGETHVTTFEPTEKPNGREGKVDDNLHDIYANHISVTDSAYKPTRIYYPDFITTVLPHHEEEATAEPVPVAQPEPTVGSVPVADPGPTAEPVAVAEPEPIAEPVAVAEPEPTAEPVTVAEPEPTAEPVPVAEPEPTAEPVPVAEPEPTAEPVHVAEPEPTAEPVPVAQLELTTDSVSMPKPEPTSEPVPAAEPEPITTQIPLVQSEPTPEPAPVAEPKPTTIQNSAAEPTVTPEPVSIAHPETTMILTTLKPENTKPSTNPVQYETINPFVENEANFNLPRTTTVPDDENVSDNHPDVTKSTQFIVENEVVLPEKTTRRFEELVVEPLGAATMKPEENEKLQSDMSGEEMTTMNSERGTSPVVTKEDAVPVNLIYKGEQQKITLQPWETNDTNDHSTENVISHTHYETHQNIVTFDPTEGSNALENMSPFLPEIENDTLVRLLHSGVDYYTDSPYHHHNHSENNEDHIYRIPVKPPRLDNDQMNVTNPSDPNPTDTVVFTTDKTQVESEERMTKKESIMKEETTSNEVATETNVPESSSRTSPKEFYPTLSPDIINNVHSNNFFFNLQTSTSTTEQTIRPEMVEENSTTTRNNGLGDLSTEDLLALETTTNNDIKGIKEENPSSTEKINQNHNGTTIFAVMIETATDVVTLRSEAETTEENSNPTQYEVHENISEDVTTTRSNILRLHPATEMAMKRNESGGTEEIFLNSRNLDDTDNNLYDPSDFLNDISDEEKSVLDKFQDRKKQKDVSKDANRDLESEKDHYLATDFTDKATFTATPGKNYFDNGEGDFYGKSYTTKLEELPTITDHQNATETMAIKPVTEGFVINGFSRCSIAQFQCRNGTAIKDGSYCIPANDRCDSTDDCTDASDEESCAQEHCRDNFQCANGQCLKRNLVCDGITNCNDKSDEENCESWQCRFDEFSCGTGGRCIPFSWKCDGHAQCPNAEDEYNCHAETCTNNEYLCIEQSTCIRPSLRCDGKQDCAGGDDENLCECALDQFKCSLGGGCVPLEQRCDGIEQCPDLSDEWNCLRVDENGTNRNFEVLSGNETWLQVCSDSWNSSYSDLVCQNLGYSEATATIFPSLNNTSGEFFRLKPIPQFGANLITQLEKTDKCDSIVSITCQDFICGSHASLDVQSARIIGGSGAAETQWPSVALLYNKKHHRQCTATLIAPRWVIASYSCVIFNDPLYRTSTSNEWVLYAGGTNFFNNADNSSTQVRAVQNIVVHPQEKYSQFVFQHDMVLVELASSLMLSQNVAVICLPDQDIEPRQLCVTAGWGVSKPGDGNLQQYLQYLPVPTIDMDECNSTKHYNGRVPNDKICAGYTDSDKTPCYNDEGAPLMCFSDGTGTWELHGVLSHHGNCGKSHHPALYSAINEDGRKWIANTIGLRPIMSRRVALNQE